MLDCQTANILQQAPILELQGGLLVGEGVDVGGGGRDDNGANGRGWCWEWLDVSGEERCGR